MRHDPDFYPALDPERRAMVAAAVATIDRRLADCRGLPFETSRRTIGDLRRDGIARTDLRGDTATLTMFGITVRTRGGDYAALTLWMQAAKDRMARLAYLDDGVRP